MIRSIEVQLTHEIPISIYAERYEKDGDFYIFYIGEQAIVYLDDIDVVKIDDEYGEQWKNYYTKKSTT